MSIGKDGFTGYIPYHLEIEGRPELSLFPLSVAFSEKKIKDGKTCFSNALYFPDLESFKLERDKDKVSLRYHNTYGGDCWLLVEYGPTLGYVGKKFVNGKCNWESSGPEWRMFFVHFTMLGLADGERCEFKIIN